MPPKVALRQQKGPADESTPGKYSFKLIFKALIALYGSILFWVGLWTSLDADFFPRSLQRDLTYTAVGLAFMIGADSFYSNAGVDGSFFDALPVAKAFKTVRRLSIT